MSWDRRIGYDLNGWHDRAARNWLVMPGEEEIQTGEFIVSGGIGGAVVRVDDGERERLVGGALARLAPQGRGSGWGLVGAPDRRLPTRRLVSEPERFRREISTAFAALGEGADFAVAAIDDVPGISEARQDAWLDAMRDARCSRILHVWRPVLVALFAIQEGLLDGVSDVAIVGQTAKGLATQRLKIRYGVVSAPERRKQGQLHECDLGLEALLSRGRDIVRVLLPDQSHLEDLESAEMPLRLALGLGTDSELHRAWNGNWFRVPPVPSLDLSAIEIPNSVCEAVRDADAILIDSVAEGSVRDTFAQLVRTYCDTNCIVVPVDAVPRGALVAATRLSQGEPVYYDFLPQISTIVQDGRGPKNFDLIPAEAALPAGKVYRSDTPASLALQSGQEEVVVFLKKELEPWPRKAVVTVPTPPKTIEEVKVYVEQVPAQGRARIMIESGILPAPITIDWDKEEQIEKEWDTLLSSLETPAPTIPKRLVLPATRELWVDQPNRTGLGTLLSEARNANEPNWKVLAEKLASREGGAYCVSSDGELPPETGPEDLSLLEEIQSRALSHTLARARGAIEQDDNNSLRFLTWLFRRCDERVVPEMIAALDADVGEHPFVFHHANRRLIYQGLGRILHEPEPIRRVFDHLFAISPGRWTSLNQVSCAAFLLSRTNEAPGLLLRQEVDMLVEIAIRTLREGLREKTLNTLHYPPFLLVGILRWRLKDNWALVAGRDSLADRMLHSIDQSLPQLKRLIRERSSLQRLYIALSDVREEVRGEGRNPNLLLELASMG